MESQKVKMALSRAEILSLYYAIGSYLETHKEHPNAENAPVCYKSCIPILEKLYKFFEGQLKHLDAINTL